MSKPIKKLLFGVFIFVFSFQLLTSLSAVYAFCREGSVGGSINDGNLPCTAVEVACADYGRDPSENGHCCTSQNECNQYGGLSEIPPPAAASAISGAAGGSSSDTSLWYAPSYQEWRTKVNSSPPSEIFGERYTKAQVWWIIYSLINFILEAPIRPGVADCLYASSAGDQLVSCLEAVLSAGPVNQPNLASNQSLIQLILADKPISAVTYFKDIARKVNLVPEAQAQTGFGFTALNPVLELWQGARNITYTLFIVIVIAMAFMIMFRVKLNPQTAITIQSALPKVVFGIILVTFSYAIAGLLIDLMYIVTGLISILLMQSGMFGSPLQPQNAVQMFNLLTQGPAIRALGAEIHLGVFGFLFRYWLGVFLSGFLLFLSANSSLVGGIGFIVATLGFLVMIIVLLFVGLKITWMLFKTLAQVFLQTIFAPLIIGFGVIVPNLGFGSWLRNYLANLAVFPATGLLLVLAALFQSISIGYAFRNIGDMGLVGRVVGVIFFFIPGIGDIVNRLIGAIPSGNWPPLLSLDSPETTLALVFLGASFAIISVVPKTVELVQSVIKGQTFAYGTAVGEAIGIGLAAPKYIAGKTFGAVSGGFEKAIIADIEQRARSGAGLLGRIGKRIGLRQSGGSSGP